MKNKSPFLLKMTSVCEMAGSDMLQLIKCLVLQFDPVSFQRSHGTYSY